MIPVVASHLNRYRSCLLTSSTAWKRFVASATATTAGAASTPKPRVVILGSGWSGFQLVSNPHNHQQWQTEYSLLLHCCSPGSQLGKVSSAYCGVATKPLRLYTTAAKCCCRHSRNKMHPRTCAFHSQLEWVLSPSQGTECRCCESEGCLRIARQ